MLSCATVDQNQQLVGGLGGALVGGVICKLAGGSDKLCMAVAAGAGTLGWAAVAVGQRVVNRDRGPTDEAALYGYVPSQGSVIEIREANVEPRSVSPGEDVAVSTNYSVLVPDGGAQNVHESWELWYDGAQGSAAKPKKIANLPNDRVRREPGGWSVDFPVTVPENAEPGSYRVVHRIAGEHGQSSQRETAFEVVGSQATS